MSDSDLNRQLLFGILAVQMDFINRDDFLDAMRQWLQRRDTSLDEILIKRGVLDVTNRDLLAPLVERHIEERGTDPAQSLSILSSIDAIREDLRTLQDHGVDATLPYLYSGTESSRTVKRVSGDAASLVADVDENKPTEVRYRVLRLHAKGGLGEVSVAKDTELNRDVALKEIRQQYADDVDSRARFLLEAEVTGGLEHPGIVPVYGLGQYSDGRPFYAMRFIKGDSLKEATDVVYASSRRTGAPLSALDYQSVEFRKLLGRFIDVCSAIEYAHSRGVLHRDLKPGNIMLGKYGETLVVDWGLAKIKGQAEPGAAQTETVLNPRSGSGSAPTEFGSVIGTPAYMSPEQAAGRLDALGVESDVYSLGGTLFYILTGEAPFKQKNLAQLLEAVKGGNLTPPRSISPGIPRPLEAICLKAMALELGDRYSSAQELADDLERWLGDEATVAYPDPLRIRAQRWLRRHQALATGAASATLATLILLALGLGLLTAANQRLDKSNALLAAANQELETSIQREQESRARADRNYALARQAVDDYFTDVSENVLLDVPGMQELRQQLLDSALAYYRDFVSAEGETLGLKSELASAHFRLGKLATGTGQAVLAREHFQQAQSLYDQVLSAGGHELDDRLNYASTFEHLALTADAVGEPETAEKDHQVALKLRQELFAENSDNARVADALIHSYNNLAVLIRESGRYEEAKELLDRAIEVGKSQLEGEATSRDHLGTLAISYNEYGILLAREGKPEEAAQAYEESIKLWQDLTGEFPESLRFKNYLASAYTNLGGVQKAQGDTQASLAGYRKAIAVFQELSARNPTVTIYRDNLAHAYQNLGNLLFSNFQREEALSAMNAALEIREQLRELQPDSVDYQHGLAAAYHNLGNIRRDAQEYEQAKQLYQQAIDLWETLHEAQPDLIVVQRGLGTASIGLGYIVYLEGDLQGCIPQLQSAIPLLDGKKDMQVPLQICHMILADAFDQLDKFSEASAAYEKAIELQSGPSRNSLRVKRALVLARAGDHPQATAEARELMLPDQVPLETIYNAACVFSLCVSHAANDEELDDAVRLELAEQYSQDAMTLLERAQRSGYFDDTSRVDGVDQDTDLDNLREQDAFIRWRAQLAKTPA